MDYYFRCPNCRRKVAIRPYLPGTLRWCPICDGQIDVSRLNLAKVSANFCTNRAFELTVCLAISLGVHWVMHWLFKAAHLYYLAILCIFFGIFGTVWGVAALIGQRLFGWFPPQVLTKPKNSVLASQQQHKTAVYEAAEIATVVKSVQKPNQASDEGVTRLRELGETQKEIVARTVILPALASSMPEAESECGQSLRLSLFRALSASLIISRSEFDAAFSLLRKLCNPRPDEEAVLSFDGSNLYIALGGMSVSPAAKGSWPGQARVRANCVMALAKVPPLGDTIEFRVDGGELRVGTTVATCAWQDPDSRGITLAENATMADVLALPMTYDAATIESAGLAGVVKHAQKAHRDKVDEAVVALEGFGVTREEIVALVEQALRRTKAV